MFLIFVGGQIDRQIMPMLAQDMKQGLRITDQQLGFLLGLGFSLTYAVGTILAGSLAARTDRIRLLSWGLAFWSLLTLCCSLATSFSLLL
jgi:predicted MFS family arabinose efflux permease